MSFRLGTTPAKLLPGQELAVSVEKSLVPGNFSRYCGLFFYSAPGEVSQQAKMPGTQRGSLS